MKRPLTNDLPGKVLRRLLEEWPLWTSLATALVFLALGESLLSGLSRPVWFALILTQQRSARRAAQCVAAHGAHPDKEG